MTKYIIYTRIITNNYSNLLYNLKVLKNRKKSKLLVLPTIAYYYRKGKQDIKVALLYINKVAINSKIKVITQRCLDINRKIDLYNYRLNSLLYNIFLRQKVLSYFISNSLIISRKYYNRLQIKSVIKGLEL